jgi:hypothetical protein
MVGGLFSSSFSTKWLYYVYGYHFLSGETDIQKCNIAICNNVHNREQNQNGYSKARVTSFNPSMVLRF